MYLLTIILGAGMGFFYESLFISRPLYLKQMYVFKIATFLLSTNMPVLLFGH